jgi:parvulin-like peptidyl-prolyl isomerase
MIGVGVFFLFFIGISWWYTYNHSDDVIQYGFPLQLSPYPAVWTSPFEIYSYKELNRDIRAIKSFFEKQDFSELGLRVDFSTDEGKKRLKIREKELLNIFLEQVAIERLVHDSGKRVTDEEINQGVDRNVQEYGSEEDLKKRLRELYDWDVETFKRVIVKPSLYRERAQEIFQDREKKEKDEKARIRIEEVKAELDKGVSFEQIAREYSEGITAQDGGHFGWISLGELLEPEVSRTLLSLDVGTISEIIESDLGYHIITVHDTKKDSTGILYDMSQIFIQKETFAQWIESAVKDLHVSLFMKGYEWDKSSGLIVFSDKEMEEFERQEIMFNTDFQKQSQQEE